jgi:uncharacterized protein (DUF2384 family)
MAASAQKQIRPTRGSRGSSATRGEAEVRASGPSTFVGQFMDAHGLVNIARVAETFLMSRPQLAMTAGLGPTTIAKAARQKAAKTQTRVKEMLEIIGRVRDWAGGEVQAMAWYRSQPIPALNGRTPEALVKSGEAAKVREYLDHLALGGYA